MTTPAGQQQSTAPKPRKLPFDLQPGEVVLLFARRHWLYFYSRLGLYIFVGLVGAVLGTWLVSATFGFGGLAGTVAIVVIALWVLYWGLRAYFHWYRYNNDLWAVTNQRLVDSLKKHWFHHQMSSADLVDVEDIRVVKEGMLHTMWNFGDVRCQTAGTEANFVLANVPNPVSVLAIVDNARDAARRELRGAV